MDTQQRTELAFRTLAKETTPRGGAWDYAEIVRDAVEKKQTAISAEKKLEITKNPGLLITEAQALSLYGKSFKNDEISNTGVQSSSTEQIQRRNKGEAFIRAAIEMRDRGFANITPARQDLLLNPLMDYLKTHPGFIARAVNAGQNPNNANAFGIYVRDEARKYLGNPVVVEKIVGKLGEDLSNPPSIDYDGLHSLMQERIDKNNEIARLKDEINNTQTGLKKKVTDAKTAYDLFGYTTVNGVRTPKDGTKEKIDVLQAVSKLRLQAELFKNSADQIADKNYFNSLPPQGQSDKQYPDPETGNDITITSGQRISKVNAWRARAVELTAEAEAMKEEVKKVSSKEDDAKKALEEAQTSLADKEKELKDLESEVGQTAVSGQNARAATGLEKRIDDKKAEIKNAEEARVEKYRNGTAPDSIIPDGLTDALVETSSVVETVATEQEQKILDDIRAQLRQEIMATYYNERSRKFDENALWDFRDAILAPPNPNANPPNFGGVVIEGRRMLTDLKGRNAKWDVVIDGIIGDPAKLKQESGKAVAEVLKLIAYKKPKMLDKMFTQDEVIMRKAAGDLLPQLVEQAKSDKSIQDELNKAFKNGQIDEGFWASIKENKGKIIGTLLLLLGIFVVGPAALGALGFTASGAGAAATTGLSAVLGNMDKFINH